MQSRILLFATVAIIIAINFQYVSAHYFDETTIQSTAEILDFCEFYYQEYFQLGERNFFLQHPYQPKLRFCSLLYAHIVWPTEHPDRDRILIAEIEKLLGDSGYIKERHQDGFSSIPNWIKHDAEMWVGGQLTDTRFAYGVRAMIDSELINPPIIDPMSKRSCDYQICIETSDYVKYSISDNYGKDVITEKYTVKKISLEQVRVNLEKTSKESRETIDFTLDLRGSLYDIIKDDERAYVIHKFIYPIPLTIGSKISGPYNNLIITHQISTTFGGLERDAFVARDSTGKYFEIIDKNTGLVLSSKFEDMAIVPVWKKTELMDTNIIEKKSGIQLAEMNIPKWWKRNTQWVLDGLISEAEYLKAMEYLIGQEIIKV